jgi:glucose-6-phosphate dehydrogenase assembly protein OpcA
VANTFKILGQVNPSATTLTDLYTVPAATQAIVASIAVCNEGSTATTFRISLAVAGAADNAKQYIYYDVPIPANSTLVLTAGITLQTTDKIRVYAGNTSLAFNAWGQQLS